MKQMVYYRATPMNVELHEPQLWRTLAVERHHFELHALGCPPEQATMALVALPPRFCPADKFLKLAQALINPGSPHRTTIVALSPPETLHFWYPHAAFDTPLELQQPYFNVSLAAIDQLMQQLAEQRDIAELSLVGFADGACVALEAALRSSYPLNAVLAFSGVLLGSHLESSDRFVAASSRTKVLLTSSTVIPAAQRVRFRQTEQLLKQCGYQVIAMMYQRRPDTLVPDELELGKNLLYGTVVSS